MLTPTHCQQKYGSPREDGPWLTLWVLPDDLQGQFAHVSPRLKRVYGSKDLFAPLEKALRNLVEAGLPHELKTWDGCFNIRRMRGANTMSLHSWGVAVDVNAAENGLGHTPNLSKEFVRAFKSAGFDWGGDWMGPRRDGMHFQLARI